MITGANLVAGREHASGTRTLRAVDPRTSQPGEVEFHEATPDEIATACAAAGSAASAFAAATSDVVAGLLRGIADELEALEEELIDVADGETALGRDRLIGERARTTGQLRAFAGLVESGEHLDPIVDEGVEGRPDIRRILVPVGPVAVFGASNFPLAFSVPGGDTASALAARCPVVVKGHPSHPGTSELCARAITRAVASSGLPAGVFSMVQGASPDVGRALVLAPEIRAVGFTGSGRAGRALYELGATRPVPIPVYAEMGSLNPVFVTAAALATRGDDIAQNLAASITQGSGQFCTKPGLIFVPTGVQGDAFQASLADALAGIAPSPMLNASIRDAFADTVQRTSALPDVDAIVSPDDVGPTLLSADVDAFIERPELVVEHFGPAAIVVRTPEDRMADAAAHIEGSLTATLHAQPGADDALVDELLPVLVGLAGRIVFDGVPTGVAVVPSMQHGGPYPATTFSGHTSVGLFAIRRFLRPVAFQNAPRDWLPEELR